MQFETFAPLAQLRVITHAFTRRDPTDDTRSESFEAAVVRSLGIPSFARAEQPHGNRFAIVEHPGNVSGVDALVTRQRNLALVIRCADCAPVFIVDRRTPAIALIHSGKKGTLANVVGATLQQMRAQDCLAFIGPSIGPCHYEMDLWSGIEAQLRDAGISEIHNPRMCTACHLDRYFSYRAEKGNTGRMVAVLCLR